MPNVTIYFLKPINVSVQKGDTAYFTNAKDVGYAQSSTSTTTPHKASPLKRVVKIGEIILIQSLSVGSVNPHIICNMPQHLYNIYYPTDINDPDSCVDVKTGCLNIGSFIMFSKDNKANMSSILGYYASAQFRNNSTHEAELFNVGVDLFESSK